MFNLPKFRVLLQVLLLYLQCFSFLAVEYIDCSSGGCSGTTVNCPNTNNACVIDCQTKEACFNKTINCNDGKDCTIVGGGGRSSVRQAVINCPNDASCYFNCTTPQQNTYLETTINCGINGECLFLIDNSAGQKGFHAFKSFNATFSNYVKILKYGKSNGAHRISRVYCPNNGRSGKSMCDIECGGDIDACDYLRVYAVEGFNDVNITDAYGGSSFNDAYMYCGVNNYSASSCNIDPNNPNQCDTTEGTTEIICDTYLMPTPDPTVPPS